LQGEEKKKKKFWGKKRGKKNRILDFTSGLKTLLGDKVVKEKKTKEGGEKKEDHHVGEGGREKTRIK